MTRATPPATADGPRQADRHTANLLGVLALAVTDRTNAALGTALGAGGNAAAALLSVGARPGLSIDQLARVLGLSHSATVRLVDRLENRGWARRTRVGEDGRTASVTLSRSGNTTFRRLLDVRHDALKRATAGLSRRERAALRTLLAKMLASLPGDRHEARHMCRLCEHSVCHGAACPVGSAV